MKNTKELTNLAVSLSDDVTTVRCVFTPEKVEYTYLCRKEIAQALVVGDSVVCERAGDKRFGIVQVAGVDSEVDLPDLNIPYVWIVQKVDTHTLERTKQWLDDTVVTLRARQRKVNQAAVARELGIEPADVLALPKLG